MKVLVVHNAYQQQGGEDTVVDQEVSMLRGKGIEVSTHIVDNLHIKGVLRQAAAAILTAYNPLSTRLLRKRIMQCKPSIVHIHNFFPTLSVGAHMEASGLGLPVVQTLHNYRPLCAAATFLRNGAICEACIADGKQNAIVHRCYRNSLVGSAAVVSMQLFAERRVWSQDVQRFIALTPFAREKFISAGFDQRRVVVKPNFLSSVVAEHPGAYQRSGLLFVGRLSPEKGLHTLLRAMNAVPHISLSIIGTGPDLEVLKRIAPSNVQFLGRKDRSEVREFMLRAQALVLPSIWYEGFPMTIVEAFASGLPVIASEIGSLSDIVCEGRNGALFDAGSECSLKNAVLRVTENDENVQKLSFGAQADFKQKYTEDVNFPRLLEIYKQAIYEKSVN